MNLKGTKKKNQVVVANIFEQQEMIEKAELIRKNLKAFTWHELETNGKFDKNAKLTFISDDMLILGCEVGSETHYLRAIDTRGRELSKSAFPFSNSSEGFQSAKEWALKTAVENSKNQIVMGLEPTGHYWYALASWMISNGISVVQVNPYAVKQTKEVEDNSQLTKISHRGRKRLRFWLFQAAKSAVAHAEEFKELHVYYTIRTDNPLKKMQSLIVIACKLLRVIYAILTKGTNYDSKKMLMDIRRPAAPKVIAA